MQGQGSLILTSPQALPPRFPVACRRPALPVSVAQLLGATTVVMASSRWSSDATPSPFGLERRCRRQPRDGLESSNAFMSAVLFCRQRQEVLSFYQYGLRTQASLTRDETFPQVSSKLARSPPYELHRVCFGPRRPTRCLLVKIPLTCTQSIFSSVGISDTPIIK